MNVRNHGEKKMSIEKLPIFNLICSMIRHKPLFEIKYRNEDSLFLKYDGRTYHLHFEDITDELELRIKNKQKNIGV